MMMGDFKVVKLKDFSQLNGKIVMIQVFFSSPETLEPYQVLATDYDDRKVYIILEGNQFEPAKPKKKAKKSGKQK